MNVGPPTSAPSRAFVALQAVRSIVFYAVFLAQTVVLALLIGTLALIVRGRRTRFGWVLARYWIASSLWLSKVIVGLRSDVAGEENIPPGPCIIAAKHMSDWDVFALLPGAGRPAFIAKKELMDIPFFGHAAMSFDTIRLDRSLGVGAIPAMVEEARAALARGARIIIFPEGTRRAPLAEPQYRQGILRLYESLGVPVVPVALNSGLFWGRNSRLLWPGVARARFLPAIPPGLDTPQFARRLEGEIEAATRALLGRAYRDGLSRPLDAELRAELESIPTGPDTP
jgi:1-acyl-sn-glycerol-3-phosphate acyltransferase